mmetsp:Transcript_24961/g.68824  ORF Transcript_24961/g.68824 Transcript_24961/m.68824 type:complete len:245 (+) Transcript_24961:5423-6157(+)
MQLSVRNLFGNLADFGKNRVGIQIFKSVKDTHSFSFLGFSLNRNLAISRPLGDNFQWNTGSKQTFSVSIIFDTLSEPVVSFRQRLEWRCTSMDSIVTCVWLGIETQFFVLVKDCATNGSLWSFRRISGTQHTSSEVLPAKGITGPRHGVPLNLFTGVAISGTHRHVESIHDVNVFHFTTVKAASELNEILATGELAPFTVDTFGIDAQFFGSVLGVIDLSGCDGGIPGFTESFLKLLLSLFWDV